MRFFQITDVVYPETNEAAADSGRLVVVIDPEDLDAVHRLVGLVATWSGVGDVSVIERWQCVLREYADPKPNREWRNGDVIQSIGSDLVWFRADNVWRPANGAIGREHDDKATKWVTTGACRVLREQAAEEADPWSVPAPRAGDDL